MGKIRAVYADGVDNRENTLKIIYNDKDRILVFWDLKGDNLLHTMLHSFSDKATVNGYTIGYEKVVKVNIQIAIDFYKEIIESLERDEVEWKGNCLYFTFQSYDRIRTSGICNIVQTGEKYTALTVSGNLIELGLVSAGIEKAKAKAEFTLAQYYKDVVESLENYLQSGDADNDLQTIVQHRKESGIQ